MKKHFLLLCLLVMLGTAACGPQNTPKPEPTPQPPVAAQPATPEPPAPPTYIFLNNFFMGSFSDNAWHSLGNPWPVGITAENSTVVQTPFLAKDIAAIPAYTLYSTEANLGVAKQIAWQIAPNEPGSFVPDVEAQLAPLALHYQDSFTTSNNYASNIGLFNLPLTLQGGDLDTLKVPVNNFYTYFPLSSTLGNKTEVLAINSTANPLPSKVQVLYNPTPELTTLLQNKLTELGIPDAPINITEHYASDFDGDGQTETLVVAQNERNIDSGYPLVSAKERTGKSGSYIIALYLDNIPADKPDATQPATTLFNLATPYDAAALAMIDKNGELLSGNHCYTLTFLGAFDLNQNGKMELCFQNNVWEGGCQLVYAPDDKNQYHCVLTSPYGI